MGNHLASRALESKVHVIRGRRVMLSPDLAQLYGVEPRALMQAVKRQRLRFPSDFMFQITRAELDNLTSQIVISSWGGRRAYPYAFTEQGVAMLSSVLNSRRAVRANIAIMRAFVDLRRASTFHADPFRRLDALEGHYDAQFRDVFDAIRALMSPPDPPKRRIGFGQ